MLAPAECAQGYLLPASPVQGAWTSDCIFCFWRGLGLCLSSHFVSYISPPVLLMLTLMQVLSLNEADCAAKDEQGHKAKREHEAATAEAPMEGMGVRAAGEHHN